VALNLVGYGSGWAIVAVGVLMIFRGRLITKREADGMQRVIDARDKTIELQGVAISAIAESVETNNHLIRAVLKVAEEQSP
jgi:predicted transcriptional regulator